VDTSNTTEQIDQDRRRLLGTATTGIVATGAAIAVVLAVLGGKAISAQDKYTVQVPNGLAYSDFRGYENWEVVAVISLAAVHESAFVNVDGQFHYWRIPSPHMANEAPERSAHSGVKLIVD
jgi:predicted S18 family serine protease